MRGTLPSKTMLAPPLPPKKYFGYLRPEKLFSYFFPSSLCIDFKYPIHFLRYLTFNVSTSLFSNKSNELGPYKKPLFIIRIEEKL